MTTTILILPGLGNSGEQHWQTLWEAKYTNAVRVQQADWEMPHRHDWVATLDAAIRGLSIKPTTVTGGSIVLVAHSLACTLVAYWAQATQQVHRIKGALLVAPSDTEAPMYPEGTQGFAPIPLERLPFPSIVAASSDDYYVSLERAQQMAVAWGSEFVNVGAHGHINAAAGFGEWKRGEELLHKIIER